MRVNIGHQTRIDQSAVWQFASLRPKLQIRVWDQRASQEIALPPVARLADNAAIELF